jgi:hypothetical protein
MNNKLVEFKELHIEIVIVVSYWAKFYVQSVLQNREDKSSNLKVDYQFLCRPHTENNQTTYLNDYKNAINLLLDNGLKVILVYPIPEPGYDVSLLTRRRYLIGINEDFTYSLNAHLRRTKVIRNNFDTIKHANLRRILPERILCDDKTDKCQVQNGHVLYYFDFSHLTMAGAFLFEHLFRDLFKSFD